MISLILTLLPLALLAIYIQKGLVIVGFSLAALGGAAVLYKNRPIIDWPSLARSSYAKAIGLVLVAWFLSGLFGLDPEVSLLKWLEYAGLTILGLVLYGALRKADEEDYRQFFQSAFWGALFFSAWAIIDAAYLLPRLTLLVHGPWLSPSSYSTILSLIFPFVLCFAAMSKTRFYWLVPFAVAVAVFACGGRSGWLAFVAAAVLCLTIFPWKDFGSPLKMRAATVALALSGSVFGLLLYRFTLSAEKFQERVASGGEYGLGTGRLDIWRFTLERIPEHPWLGIGMRNFRALDFSHAGLASTAHPHNVPLELLLETGIIGFTVVLLVIALPVGQFFERYGKRDGLACCSFVALAGYGVASLTLTSFFHAWWFVVGATIFILLKLALERLKC